MVIRYFFIAIREDQRRRYSIDSPAQELENIEGGSVGPVDILDDDNGLLIAARDCIKDGVEHFASGTFNYRVLQDTAHLERYVVERSERPRRRKVIARTPQDPGIIAVIVSKRSDQTGLADTRLTANENNRAGATAGFKERPVHNLKICRSFEKIHNPSVPHSPRRMSNKLVRLSQLVVHGRCVARNANVLCVVPIR